MQGKNIFLCKDANEAIMKAFHTLQTVKTNPTTTTDEKTAIQKIQNTLYKASENLEKLDW